MDIVVDAQILGWYYKADVLGLETPCTGDAAILFSGLGDNDFAFLDEGGIVEGEWREQAASEWFDIWLADRMAAGDIAEIAVDTCQALIRSLRTKCGFP